MSEEGKKSLRDQIFENAKRLPGYNIHNIAGRDKIKIAEMRAKLITVIREIWTPDSFRARAEATEPMEWLILEESDTIPDDDISDYYVPYDNEEGPNYEQHGEWYIHPSPGLYLTWRQIPEAVIEISIGGDTRFNLEFGVVFDTGNVDYHINYSDGEEELLAFLTWYRANRVIRPDDEENEKDQDGKVEPELPEVKE
jgi:hypothetical protein